MSVKCNKIIIHAISPLALRITGGTSEVIEKTHNNEIVGLKLPDDKKIKLGQVLNINKLPYKINSIIKQNINGLKVYDLEVDERTSSSIFIMPMLGGSRKLFLYDQHLMNCFLTDIKSGELGILLVYRFSEDTLFLKLIYIF